MLRAYGAEENRGSQQVDDGGSAEHPPQVWCPGGEDQRVGVLELMCVKKPKHASPRYSMPYNQRILNYNLEKQSALSVAVDAEEADRIIRYLRKKWKV